MKSDVLPSSYLVTLPKEVASPQAPLLLLAHGAGAPMDSLFMNLLAEAMADNGVGVVRFEFPYMAQRREGGSKRPAPKAETLIEVFCEHVSAVASACSGPVVIGGKSMGARISSMLVSGLSKTDVLSSSVLGAVGFGFPFHAPGKPAGKRVDHLKDVQLPVHIIQGTRDPFGKPVDVEGYSFSDTVSCDWLDSADHDFKPLKASGLTQAQCIQRAASIAASFIKKQYEKTA